MKRGRKVLERPPPLSKLRADVDAHLEAICLKAMAKEPSRRFLCMAEFAQAIDDYLQGAVDIHGRPRDGDRRHEAPEYSSADHLKIKIRIMAARSASAGLPE